MIRCACALSTRRIPEHKSMSVSRISVAQPALYGIDVAFASGVVVAQSPRDNVVLRAGCSGACERVRCPQVVRRLLVEVEQRQSRTRVWADAVETKATVGVRTHSGIAR